MQRTKRPSTSLRKAPLQARSTQLVADILKAAVRVLEREGATRFTTIRVAEVAGVSVGSLYQYFPNKQAILFRLQLDEWTQTGAIIDQILTDGAKPWQERLRTMVRAFFDSECEEAPLRQALDAAAPDYHDAPEAMAKRSRRQRVMGAFIALAAPRATPAQRKFAGEFVSMTVTSIGKQVSERAPGERQIEQWASTVSDVLVNYLQTL